MDEHPLPSALPDFLDQLSHRVAGDLRTDAYSRILYATDASIYQAQPYGVLLPRSEEDVQAAVEAAAKYGVPILARGAGSSLAGQAVNTALVVDMSRHLDAVLEVNREERWVRVQPGVVLDELNLYLAAYGLQFGPDPASSNRATLGGIVSNNSTGSHSIVYGMTADHVLEARGYLSDGTAVHFHNLDESMLAQKLEASGLEGEVYRRMTRIASEGAGTIRAGTPRHWRRCGGYNLDRLIEPLAAEGGGTSPTFRLPPAPGFNLASLVCGAEGTLALMAEIKLNLVALPKKTALGVVHFSSLREALSSVPHILECGPSAVELLDHIGLTRSRQVPAYARLQKTFIEGDPNCVLIAEFSGDTEGELLHKMAALEASGVGDSVVALYDPALQAGVWTLRKVALGFLMSVKGDFKPVPFIEDAAVPVEHLADYIRQVEEFCNGLGTEVGYYAHASAGCLHVRPLINTKAAEEVAKMQDILAFSVELLGGYGGALSSEHGDGRARSWINERFFGKDLYALYRKTKQAFDPQGLLNPGNIVDAPPMDQDLRYGPAYRTLPLREHLDFTEDMGFHRAVEMCNGAGICRKKTAGTMCPSFMVTREEEHSTRGRANALRAALSGALPHQELTSRRMFEVMDLCIECKACKAECPSSVDMAKIKFEFLAQYYEKHPVSARTRLFASMPQAVRWLSGPLAPLANWGKELAPVKWGLHKFLGISAKRELPAFARQSFSGRDRGGTEVHVKGTGIPDSAVVLFVDTFNNYNHPETLEAAFEVLEAAGCEVLLSNHGCCGRPLISKGLVREARAAAQQTVAQLYPLAQQGIPILGLEPSCLSALVDDYASLLPGNEQAAAVAAAARPIEDFITGLAESGELRLAFDPKPELVLLHGHCHQKALFGTENTRKMLALANASVQEVDSGCCGMAGAFGYEAEHYEISIKMGERRLLPAVRAHQGAVAAPGVSCRAQIEHGAGVRARHPIEILRDALVEQAS